MELFLPFQIKTLNQWLTDLKAEEKIPPIKNSACISCSAFSIINICKHKRLSLSLSLEAVWRWRCAVSPKHKTCRWLIAGRVWGIVRRFLELSHPSETYFSGAVRFMKRKTCHTKKWVLKESQRELTWRRKLPCCLLWRERAVHVQVHNCLITVYRGNSVFNGPQSWYKMNRIL